MIEILLSTYNGERFLKEQLDSLLNQTCRDWRLLVRDDGSGDGTVSLLCEYAARYPGRIVLHRDEKGNLGSSASFSELAAVSTAAYLMFCDQDDFWFPEKVEKTFAAMRQLEELHPGIPLLVATDLTVADERLNRLAPSFIRSQRLFPEALEEVHRSLALSVAPGCTMMVNRAAVPHFLPVPKELIHDHWIAVIVSHYGKIRFLPEPTMLYRQHGRNVIGAHRIGIRYFLNRTLAVRRQIRAIRALYRALPFRINPARWLFYKLYYTLKRSF